MILDTAIVHIRPHLYEAGYASHEISACLCDHPLTGAKALAAAADQADIAAREHAKIAAYLRAEADRATRKEHAG